MSEQSKVSIYTTSNFEKEAKKLIKKYPSLLKEFSLLKEQILTDPRMGADLGNNVFKIRLAVKSKGKGKRGGLRVITYVILFKNPKNGVEVYLISVYDKSTQRSISNSVLKYLIEQIQIDQ